MATAGLQVDARAGKFLTFALGKEEYGFEILKVREIMGVIDITQVPSMPSYVLGVINLRGNVVPVVDLRKRFAMPAVERTAESCIIVVSVREKLMGIYVDRVSEVINILGEDIEDAPSLGGDSGNNYILGMAKFKGTVKILLNIDAVMQDVP
jgi:purine-binding chemotaxis protein CheW